MEVELTLKNYRCFSDQNPAKIIIRQGFTALVGVNNAGKSALLRFFYEFRDLFVQMRPQMNNALVGPVAFSLPSTIQDMEALFHRHNERDLEVSLRILPERSVAHEGVETALQLNLTVPRSRNVYTAMVRLPDGRTISGAGQFGLEGTLLSVDGKPAADLYHLYEFCDSMARCMYIGPFRNALNLQSEGEYFDIQVGRGLIATWKQWLTGEPAKQREAALRLSNDIGHIFGHEGMLITASHDERSLHVTLDRTSYSLSELGSGLAQFIIVMINAARRNPSIILVDEPETNLHPSLQTDFLTTLGSYAPDGVMFSTHSIGLARASADWIYSVRRTDTAGSQVRELEATANYAEFLGELSFSGYRELGFDRILLVEGPTEVRVFHQFLRVYRKDHTVVVLPLGGGSLINGSVGPHLDEITRITTNVSAVVDSDRDREGGPVPQHISDFQRVCGGRGINCHILDRRAIENYFPERVVSQASVSNLSALGPFESRNRALWPRTENWRFARRMSREELDTTDLGEFLASL